MQHNKQLGALEGSSHHQQRNSLILCSRVDLLLRWTSSLSLNLRVKEWMRWSTEMEYYTPPPTDTLDTTRWITFLAAYFTVEDKDDEVTSTVQKISNKLYPCIAAHQTRCRTVSRADKSRLCWPQLPTQDEENHWKNSMLPCRRVTLSSQWKLTKKSLEISNLEEGPNSQYNTAHKLECSGLLCSMKPKFKKTRVTEPWNKNARWRWNQLQIWWLYTGKRVLQNYLTNARILFNVMSLNCWKCLFWFEHPTI